MGVKPRFKLLQIFSPGKFQSQGTGGIGAPELAGKSPGTVDAVAVHGHDDVAGQHLRGAQHRSGIGNPRPDTVRVLPERAAQTEHRRDQQDDDKRAQPAHGSDILGKQRTEDKQAHRLHPVPVVKGRRTERGGDGAKEQKGEYGRSQRLWPRPLALEQNLGHPERHGRSVGDLGDGLRQENGCHEQQ